MHVFRLSLPGVFKNIPSLGSEISGVLSSHQVVSISRNFYKEKKMERKITADSSLAA